MSGAISTLTYLYVANLLTQLIYTRTNSFHKGIPFFRKAWNINEKVSAKINQRHKKKTKKHYNDCGTSYINICIDFLSINYNFLSALLHFVYHQISDYEIYTALARKW